MIKQGTVGTWKYYCGEKIGIPQTQGVWVASTITAICQLIHTHKHVLQVWPRSPIPKTGGQTSPFLEKGLNDTCLSLDLTAVCAHGKRLSLNVRPRISRKSLSSLSRFAPQWQD